MDFGRFSRILRFERKPTEQELRRFIVRLSTNLGRFVDIAGPPVCLICESPLRRWQVCFTCLKRLLSLRLSAPIEVAQAVRKDLGRGLRGLWAAYQYEFPLNECIVNYKFRGRWQLLPLLQRLFLIRAKEIVQTCRPDGIVPVPASLLRALWRGSDLPAALARYLSKALKIPFLRPLRRSPISSRQTGKSRLERLELSSRNYHIRTGSKIAFRNLLLVDDVLTTGKTAITCAELLLLGGARSVTVLALAHG